MRQNAVHEACDGLNVMVKRLENVMLDGFQWTTRIQSQIMHLYKYEIGYNQVILSHLYGITTNIIFSNTSLYRNKHDEVNTLNQNINIYIHPSSMMMNVKTIFK